MNGFIHLVQFSWFNEVISTHPCELVELTECCWKSIKFFESQQTGGQVQITETDPPHFPYNAKNLETSSICHKHIHKLEKKTWWDSPAFPAGTGTDHERKDFTPYVQVGVAESTSVAVGLAIRGTVGHVFHGADRRHFLEVLAKGLHTEGRYWVPLPDPQHKEWHPTEK